MICIFLSHIKSFESEDDLRLKCTLCQKVVAYHQTNLNQIHPFDNSFCNKDPKNKYCKFIMGVSEQYLQLTNPIQKNEYCTRSSLCPKNLSEDLSGSRCESCVFLANHLNHVPKENQTTAFSSFCLTSRPATTFLCGDIEDDGLDYFLRDLEKYKEPEQVCVKQHFCKRKKHQIPNETNTTTETNQTEEAKQEL